MNIPCIILDDERLAREKIELYLSQVEWIDIVGTYATAKELMDAFPTLDSHLLFLDIGLPDISGMEIAVLHHQNNFIIFTTAYAEYAVDGYNLEATDYLLKPFSMERFQKALSKIKDVIPNSSFVLIKEGKRTHRVRNSEIYYIEGMREYVIWHTLNGKIIEHNSLKSVIDRVEVGGFIQVHKSFIINIAQIEYFESDLLGIAGQEIPIGRKYKAALVKDVLSQRDIRDAGNLGV